jgi:hypothetical protein
MDNMYMATVRFTMVSVAFSSRDISGSTAMTEQVSHRAEVMREWCNKKAYDKRYQSPWETRRPPGRQQP